MNVASLVGAADSTDARPSRAGATASRDGVGFAGAPETPEARRIRLLVFTSLYPNAAQPRHGRFVEERLRHLVKSGHVAATVVAPVPWFPFRHRRFGAYAAFARVPECDERYGIRILYPRYPVIPKLGMNLAPSLMYRALLPVVRKLADEQIFDLVDAHYFYPDGVVAARLCAALNKPVVITARGSDINVIARHPKAARKIKWAGARAAAIVAVSNALKDEIVALGTSPDKVMTLRNGVDLERFRPLQRARIRERLSVTGPVWLAVGNLVEPKGVHIAIAALADARDVTLLVAGDGPEAGPLAQSAQRLGVADRVRMLGAVEHDALCDYYNAADAVVLASSREGMPNVVLESLACGTPVLATAVGGIPELVACPAAGELMRERTPEALVQAWDALRSRNVDRVVIRNYALTLGWRPVVEAQCALYARVFEGSA